MSGLLRSSQLSSALQPHHTVSTVQIHHTPSCHSLCTACSLCLVHSSPFLVTAWINLSLDLRTRVTSSESLPWSAPSRFPQSQVAYILSLHPEPFICSICHGVQLHSYLCNSKPWEEGMMLVFDHHCNSCAIYGSHHRGSALYVEWLSKWTEMPGWIPSHLLKALRYLPQTNISSLHS